MKKRIILFGLLFLIVSFQILITEKVFAWKERELELDYPKIGTEVPPATIKAGLPNYVKYIFTLAVGIIGFIIFGVLIHSGILYLTSAGNINQMTDAKDRILKAFLGGLLLLASVLIFNTINPQLTILELKPVTVIRSLLSPAVYICSVEIGNIEEHLNKYFSNTPEEQKKGVEEITKIIKDKNNNCRKLNASISLRQPLKSNSPFTIFIIPRWALSGWEYDYGIILHQEENYTGKCKIITSTGYSNENNQTGDIYQQVNPHHPQSGFDIKSVTIFQKLRERIDYSKYDGITLYEKTGYNKGETDAKSESFKIESEQDTIRKITGDDLKINSATLLHNTRSMKISPRGGYFALLKGKGDGGKICQIKESSDSTFANEPMGSCGIGCKGFGGWWADLWGERNCQPCLEELWLIKGKVLK